MAKAGCAPYMAAMSSIATPAMPIAGAVDPVPVARAMSFAAPAPMPIEQGESEVGVDLRVSWALH